MLWMVHRKKKLKAFQVLPYLQNKEKVPDNLGSQQVWIWGPLDTTNQKHVKCTFTIYSTPEKLLIRKRYFRLKTHDGHMFSFHTTPEKLEKKMSLTESSYRHVTYLSWTCRFRNASFTLFFFIYLSFFFIYIYICVKKQTRRFQIPLP